jgi:hypothetical protein
MKIRVYTTAMALACCVALAAGVQAKSHGAKTSGNRMTFTGCLQSGTTPDTYVLNNATTETAKSSRNKSTNNPSEMARSENSSFTVVPEGKINLQNFVGQRVRVTGRMSGESMSGESSMSNSSSTSSGNTNQSSMSGQNQLRVTSIHKISGSCQ